MSRVHAAVVLVPRLLRRRPPSPLHSQAPGQKPVVRHCRNMLEMLPGAHQQWVFLPKESHGLSSSRKHPGSRNLEDETTYQSHFYSDSSSLVLIQ